MLESDIKKLTVAVIQLTEALHTVRLPAAGGATSAITPASEPVTQATPEAAPAVASEPAPTPVAASVAAPEVTAPAAEVKAPTKKQLVEKFIELAQAKDREVAVKLLADFGVSKLPELTDKAKWPEFIVAVDKLLAG